jgi:hypothetical protein
MNLISVAIALRNDTLTRSVEIIFFSFNNIRFGLTAEISFSLPRVGGYYNITGILLLWQRMPLEQNMILVVPDGLSSTGNCGKIAIIPAYMKAPALDGRI